MDKIKNIINNNGVVIFPTDTVLALSCSIKSQNAIRKIYQIKKRSYDKPLALLASSVDQLEEIAILNKIGHDLLLKYKPRSITLICQLKPGMNFTFAAKNNTIGIRITTHPIALSIIKAINSCVVATSVNISGDIALKDTAKIPEDIIKQVDYVIKGSSYSDYASKIIDISQGKEIHLRY